MKETLNLALRLSLICAVAAAALAQVAGLTAEPIRLAEEKAMKEAVSEVLPGFESLDTIVLNEGQENEATYFVGRAAEGSPSGTAYTAVTRMGYSGEIEVMIGLNSEGAVNGVRVLRHAETPGLGANYAQPSVLERFKNATAADNIKVKNDGGTIDILAGATITCRALCDAINIGFARYAENLAALESQTSNPAVGGSE
jgi:electron transport complex protein RnfG